MHGPPTDLSEAELCTALLAGWRIEPSSIAYAPVGFGSHHWIIVESASRRWFVTADPVDDSSTRLADLSAALLTTLTLRRDARLEFVRAPVQQINGGLLQVSGRYAIAVYPYLDVTAETTSDYAGNRVVDLVIALHAATSVVEQLAVVDDFGLPGRWSVQHQLDSGHVDLPAGPYAASFHDLIAEHHTILSEALLAYDRMASLLAADHMGWVITHGEPKINNILITSNGPVMIDWDTVRLAPPTRDLWMTGGHQRYAELTGRQLPSEQLDFYRLRWDLADLCSYGSWFCRPHEDTPDIQLGWQGAVAICARLSAGTPGPPWAQQSESLYGAQLPRSRR
jgi:spectinomycin phosphotransferase